MALNYFLPTIKLIDKHRLVHRAVQALMKMNRRKDIMRYQSLATAALEDIQLG
jgi:hypothetical protein